MNVAVRAVTAARWRAAGGFGVRNGYAACFRERARAAAARIVGGIIQSERHGAR